ncbi:O-antigen ligase family protein [Ectothiorhodospira haloalkaliphila]|uniref:O-antigen ligase family protein n=1 Tax=Ectothiorhodospira haloalkaliphila TaxID=421628 RepID=UPI001EE7F7B5|nr:O-antigen ligase family protein [Ectothiorhodospira haloalkaliphila]MCG5523513.1 O-antigen ligase family protein [Ectothiorhodospira haloalkaliphila]
MKAATGKNATWLEWLGWSGAGLLGLSTLGTSFGYLGTALMLCWLLVNPKELRPVLQWRDMATLTLLLFSCYVSLLASVALHLHPGYMQAIADGYWYYMHIPLAAIPLACWLSLDMRRIYFLLLLLGVGLVGRILLHMELDAFASPSGERYGFGFAIIVFGLYMATGILALLLMGGRLYASLDHRGLAWSAGIIMMLCVLLFCYALFLTYSRAAWISLALVAPLSLLALSLLKWKRGRGAHGPVLGIMLLCLCILMLVWVKVPDIKQRLLANDATISAILSGQWQDLPPDAVGLRMHMTLYGIERFMDRPMTGWGPGSSRPLLDAHEYLHEARNVHNAYVHLLMELGVMGVVFVLLFVGYLLLQVVNSYRHGLIGAELLIWLFGAFIILALWSFTAIRFDKADGRFYLIMLLAIMMSLNYAVLRHRASI